MSGLNEIFANTATAYTPAITAKLPKPPQPVAAKPTTQTAPASVGISPRALALGVGIPVGLMAVVAAVQYLPWWLLLALALIIALGAFLLIRAKKRKRSTGNRVTSTGRPSGPTGSRQPTGRVPFMKNFMNRIRPNRTPKQAHPRGHKTQGHPRGHKTQGHPNRTATGSPKGTRSPFRNPFANRNKTGSPRQQGHPANRTGKRSPFRNPFAKKPQGNHTGRPNRNSPTGSPKGTGSRNRWGRPNKNKPTGHKTQGQPNRTGTRTGSSSWNPFTKRKKPKTRKTPTRTNFSLYNPPNGPRPPGSPNETKPGDRTGTGSPQQNRDANTGDRTWTASEGTGSYQNWVHDSDWYSTTGRPTTTKAWAERLDDEKITKVQDGQPRTVPKTETEKEPAMSNPALPLATPPQPPWEGQTWSGGHQTSTGQDTGNDAVSHHETLQLNASTHRFMPDSQWAERTTEPVAHYGRDLYEKDYAATTSRIIREGMKMHPVEAPYAAKIASCDQTYAGLAQALVDVAEEAREHAKLDDLTLQDAKQSRGKALAQGHDVSAIERKIRELSESYDVRIALAKDCEAQALDIQQRRIPAKSS